MSRIFSKLSVGERELVMITNNFFIFRLARITQIVHPRMEVQAWLDEHVDRSKVTLKAQENQRVA